MIVIVNDLISVRFFISNELLKRVSNSEAPPLELQLVLLSLQKWLCPVKYLSNNRQIDFASMSFSCTEEGPTKI